MIVPRKSLGQHFLRDENVARKIVESLRLQSGDAVLEIGPGTGALTKLLLERVDKLLAIEVDSRAAALLREQFGSRIDLIEGDVREVDPSTLSRHEAPRFRVVGNIPYYITSDLLFWIVDHRRSFLDATLMMQKEVAQRLTAKPKTKAYGILSVLAQFYATPELLFRVSPNSFYPKPTVDSAVVRLTLRETLPEHSEDIFRKVVRSTFGKRRKTLANGLRYLGLTDRQVDGITFDLKRRPEELTWEEFLALTREVGEKLGDRNLKS